MSTNDGGSIPDQQPPQDVPQYPVPPVQQPVHPGYEQPVYPGQQPGYPVQDPYGQQPVYPGQQPGYPVQDPYAGQQPGYPVQDPYAGQQPGYPGQQPGYPVQDPYAAQQPGYPGQAWAQQPAPVPPVKKGLGTGAIIGIVAGAVGLVVVIGAVVAILVGLTSGKPSEELAAEAVESYLTALAENDAETALSLIGTPPADTTLLTDEMLEASNERAQLGDIDVVVPKTADMATEVTATYSIGDEVVEAVFRVEDYDDDGVWTVLGGTSSLGLTLLEDLTLTLNGIALESDRAEVFPGSYELATTTPNFELTGPTAFTVTAPFETPDLFDVTATLTEEGVTTFRSLVQAAVAECLASKQLVAGCGLDIPATLSDGTTIVDGTLTRTLTADGQAKLAGISPEKSYSDPLFVNGPFIGGVETKAECSQNGRSGTCSVLFGPSLGAPLVDFTTDPPTLRWD